MVKTGWGGYLPEWLMEREIEAAAKVSSVRAWRFGSRWCAFRSESQDRTVKRQWHPSGDRVSEFLDDCRHAGIRDPRPSGYHYPWREWTRLPRLNPTTVDVLLRHRADAPHAWEEALRPGEHPGKWWQYDMRSAYAWATASKDLPDTRAPVYTRRVTGRRHGYYLLRSVQWGARVVPRRFRRDLRRGWWVTREEMEVLDAHRPEVVLGIEFSRSIDLRPDVDRVLARFPLAVAKRVLQLHWGAWLSRKGVEQFQIKDRDVKRLKPLPALHFNPFLAWSVMSRVALRCAEFAATAAHVYTDSLIVPHSLPEGSNFGDWRLVQTLDDPWISAAGNYGERGRVLKHAGKLGGGRSLLTGHGRDAG